MNDNCPADCSYCLNDSMQESEELNENILMAEEDDANFADQDA